jgi:hypothetical protein
MESITEAVIRSANVQAVVVSRGNACSHVRRAWTVPITASRE